MPINRDALRKGTKAIEEALESRQRGDFRPFLSNIFWKDDKDYRYLLFLNPIEEVPEVEFHPFIDLDDNVPHMTMARTDPSIGERKDPIHDQWDYKPRLTNLAIAVELEPTMKLVNGREKPAGFEVATRTFERKVRDDEGEDTGDTEEVTVPLVGLVAQSPYNFFNQLMSFDATEGPVDRTPLKITRLGKKDNVTYQVTGYDVEVDRTNLLECIGNLSYVEDADAILGAMEGLDDVDASNLIGEYLLYRRLEEFGDEEQYDAILAAITKPAKFGDKKDKKEKTKRATKPSQRRNAVEETPEAEAEVEETKVTKAAPGAERLEELKRKARTAKKSA